LTARFESRLEEKIFGMGQYQHGFLNQKNCVLELAQRNSQASVAFALSSLGYGFLWNNPAIGKVAFGKNCTEWTALSTKQLHYWITAGDEPAELVANYAAVTGTVRNDAGVRARSLAMQTALPSTRGTAHGGS
jgi:alpha-D-xyloside xylohydrolase